MGQGLLTALLLGTALATIGSAPPAGAQQAAAPSGQVKAFNIRPQSLQNALTIFGQQAGVQVSVDAAAIRGLSSPGVSGSMTPQAAVAELLSTSGLSYRFTSPSTVLVSKPAPGGEFAADGSAVLDAIVVQGQADGTNGIVATRSSAGTKTDTPILEVPQTVNVVTREEMDERGVTDLNGAVAYTPGLRAVDYPGGQGAPDIYMRGFRDVGQFSLYTDGLRAGFNAYDADFEPFAYERIDVLKGPSSVLYGQGTPGGLVNLTTKRPSETPVREVQLQYGSYDRKQVGVDVGGALTQDGSLLYRFTGLVRDSDTQIDHSPDDRIYIAPALTWNIDETTELTLLGSYQKLEQGGAEQSLPMDNTIFDNGIRIPSSLYLGVPGESHWNTENISMAYEFSHGFASDWEFNSKARYTHSDVDYVSGFFYDWPYSLYNGQYARLMTQKRPKETNGIVLDNSINGKFATGTLDHDLLFGVDYGHYNGKEKRTNSANFITIDVLDPVYVNNLTYGQPWSNTYDRIQQLGLYAQDQIKWQSWILTLGARQDWVEGRTTSYNSRTLFGGADQTTAQSDSAFTGRVGLGYLFENGVAPYASYATSFQPTLGTDFSGSPFEPTTGEQWEAGVKYQPLGWNGFFSAAVFQITQQNVTTNDPLNPGFSVQEGEIRSRGFELEAKTELWDGLSLTAGYAYTDAKVTKDNPNGVGISKVGTRFQSVPYHQASLWLDYQFAQESLLGLEIGGGVRYVGDSMAVFNAATGSQVEVPGYTLFDAAVSYDFGARFADLKGLSFRVSGTNLTDEKYYTPGFTDNSVFAGNRRAVIATFSYKW